jgi:hypothetical protein
MSTIRRPWRVHVRDIGPSFSYASEEKARAKAIALVTPGTQDGSYAEVLVSHDAEPFGVMPWYRTVYNGPDDYHVELYVRHGDGLFDPRIHGWQPVAWVRQKEEASAEG